MEGGEPGGFGGAFCGGAFGATDVDDGALEVGSSIVSSS